MSKWVAAGLALFVGVVSSRLSAQAPPPATTQALPGGQLTAMLPDAPGQHCLRFATKVGDKSVTIPCRLFIPKGYDKTKDLFPAIVFLHSEAERGVDLAAVANAGPERLLRANDPFRDAFKFITISPQCPPDLSWDDPAVVRAVLSMLDEIGKSFRIDPERVCLTGSGMGATAAWRMAMEQPDRFAAVASTCGKSVDPKAAATKLKHTASWLLVSPNEKEALAGYAPLVEALKNGKADVQLGALGNNAAECSAAFFGDGKTYEWFTKQKRRSPKEKQDREAAELAATQDEVNKLPKTPGFQKMQFSTWVGASEIVIPYLLYLPRGYDKNNDPCPTILFMHGGGEADRNLQGMFVHGPGMELKNEKFAAWYPFITIFPAYDPSPERITAVARLVEYVARRWRVDGERVYVTGLSLGGTGTWQVAQETPDRFAAIVPFCGRAFHPEVAGEKLKYLSTWIVIGTADMQPFTEGAQQMFASLTKSKADVQISLLPGEGHNVWTRYFGDQRYYEWLLQHRRLTPEQRAARDKWDPAAALTTVPQEPGQYRLAYSANVGGKAINLTYGLYIPKSYPTTQAKVPALLAMHDLPDRASDLPSMFVWGKENDQRATDKVRGAFGMIAITPQLPSDRQAWDPDLQAAVLSLMDDLSQKLRLDTDRVYLTGWGQFGGAAAWAMAIANPDRFAAVVPAYTAAPPVEQVAPKLRYGAVWLACAGDPNGPKAWVDALAKTKPQMDVQLSVVPDPAAAPLQPYYVDPKLSEWLLAHKRLSKEERAAREAADAREEAARVPEEPGHYRKVYEVKVGEKIIKLPAMVYVPAGYNANKDKRALHLFLHDADARGADLAGVLKVGPDAELTKNPKFKETYTFLGLSPQCPPDRQWTEPEMIAALNALVADFSKRARVDENRIYLSGVGAMGGAAAWQLALAAPDNIAAVAAVAAPAIPAEQIAKLKYVATAVYGDTHDAASSAAAKQVYDAHCNAAGEATCVLVPNPAATGGWQQVFSGPRLYEWLGSHHKLNPEERKARDARADRLAKFVFPAAPGFYKLSYPALVDGKLIEQPFLLTIPEGYDKMPEMRWPVLIFNHGGGEGQPDLSAALVHGPNSMVNGNPTFKAWYPFIGIAPIWDGGPDRIRADILLLDEVLRKMRADADRVYASGLSLGGTCTWTQALEAPDRFAAIVPICGRHVAAETAGERLKYLSTWIVVGGADGDFTMGAGLMSASLAKAKADFACTVVPGQGHGIWIPYFADQRLYEWLLQHRRLSPEQRIARDKTLTAPLTAPPPVPNQPGNYRLPFQTQAGGRTVSLPYGLYLPKGYPAANQKYPLLVFLHHEGEKAMDVSMVINYGADADPRKDEKQRLAFPMIAIAPQCPADKNWTDPDMAKSLVALVDAVSKAFPVDPDRVYATGISTGGTAVWQIAMEDPDRFAAIVPVIGGAVPFDQAAAKLKYSAAWTMVAAGDGGQMQVAQQAADQFRKAHAELRITPIPPTPAPGTWQPYYTDPAFCQWLLDHKRMTQPERQEWDQRLAAADTPKPPTAPGHHNLMFATKLNGKCISLPYRLYLPNGYDKSNDPKPMLLFLHGVGERGTDLAGNMLWGPDPELQRNPKLRDLYPMIGLSPQCPPDRRWDDPEMIKAVLALIDDVCGRYRVDPDRIYATGVSMGGTALWPLAADPDRPDRFAAIAPAGAMGMKPEAVGEKFKRTAAWIIVGANDAAFTESSKQMAEVLKKAGGEVQLTLVPDGGHVCWQPFYADAKSYEWMLKHKKAR